MATMIPPDPPAHGPGSHAEREVFVALRDQLDDEYTVFHGLCYLGTADAQEGESDFLIVHRVRGLLNLEVKGAGVACTPNGKWTRMVDGRRVGMRKTPFEQARRTIHGLVDEVTRRAEALFVGAPNPVLPFGYAVAFPLTHVASFPIEANEAIVFDASDLDKLGERVHGAYAFWRGGRRQRERLSEGTYKRLLRRVLTPRLGLVPSLGARLDLETRALLRVSEQQRAVLEGLLVNGRLKVRGCAGSGKTVLAAEAARGFAQRGARVLYLCFNRYLAFHMEKVLEADSTLAGDLRVTSFHRLCRIAASALGKRMEVPTDPHEANAYFNDEAPLLLLEAIAEEAIRPFDALVVDEGQDFEPDWWPVLEELLRRPKKDPLVVFYDPGQNIFGRDIDIPLGGAPEFELRVNFRNTQRITESVAKLTDMPMVPHRACPVGESPKVLLQRRPAKAAAALEELVLKLIDREHIAAHRIAILTPHSRRNSALAGLDHFGDHRITDDPFRHDGVLHTTIGRFKGLESDVVIFMDVDPDDPLCNRNARYVATSRARTRLYVFEKGGH